MRLFQLCYIKKNIQNSHRFECKGCKKLSIDGHPVYVDAVGNPDDLDQVLMDYELNTDEIESSLFNTIDMSIGTYTKGIDYLIKISIQREHDLGVYPIEIKVKGLAGQISDIRGSGEDFIHFLNQIDFSFRNYLEVDDVVSSNDVGLVVNEEEKDTFKQENPETEILDSFSDFPAFNSDFLRI